MTITRVGSNNAYASGWSSAFGGKKRKAAETTDSTAKAAPAGKTKGAKPATKGKSTAGASATATLAAAPKKTAKKSAKKSAAAKTTAKKSAPKKVTAKKVTAKKKSK